MGHIKHAQPDHPILEVLSQRWSPYFYNPQPIERTRLIQCLEAARWAASSYNEQPWSFIVALREDEADFEQMLSCLVEANQAWARRASVLMITVIQKHFSKNGKPNRVAEHDLGLSMGNFCAQATALDLHVHQMAGVNLARARQVYQIPDTHEPFTAAAIGYAAQAAGSQDELAQRDQSPRTRKPLPEIVFADQFGQTSPLVDG